MQATQRQSRFTPAERDPAWTSMRRRSCSSAIQWAVDRRRRVRTGFPRGSSSRLEPLVFGSAASGADQLHQLQIGEGRGCPRQLAWSVPRAPACCLNLVAQRWGPSARIGWGRVNGLAARTVFFFRPKNRGRARKA